MSNLHRPFPVIAAALVLSAASSATGQTVPRITQDVVVTATIAPMSLESLGRSVTILTREDLERLGLSSIVDALRFSPGMDARARGPRDVQTDFSVRGATFGQCLVLVDGLRLNDTQSGHHNGDIPMAAAGIDRIEVVTGAGSTVHGADALGGTINVISRTDRHATGEVAAGQFGYAEAQGSFSGGPVPAGWMVTGWASRSRGFTFDRDFALGGGTVRGAMAPGWTLDLRHQRKAFGASGFYGASPSKEWTDQTIAATSWHTARGAWFTDVRGSWRNHGDHFRWDINRPGFAENRHRTNNAAVTVSASRDFGGGRRLTTGGSAGADLVRSSNLGDRDYRHHSLYAELHLPLSARATLATGVRIDHYSTFGASWSPAASFSVRVAPEIKVRAAVGHAFRIPTFTELYYHDPANLGTPDLRAERGWSVDGGIDWSTHGWMLSASPFARWDRDVIDWVRPTTADLWRSTNVRNATTLGLEVSGTRRWRQALVRAYVSSQSVDAPALSLLSKYVLEYARRSVGASIVVPAGPGLRLMLNADYRARLDGQRYTLVGLRISRQIGRTSVFLDGTNLLDTAYREVAGVEMPGRWVTAGVAFR